MRNENAELTHFRLQSGYKMQTENLKSFFVWCVMTCHLPTHRASRSRFSAISFHNYLHYFGIFLAHFLMKIRLDCNIISSLHIVFSLCAQVHQRNKSRWKCRCKRDVTVDYITCATFEKQLTAFHVVRIIIFLSGMCLFCWKKCGPRPKLFLRLDIFSTLVDHIILTYLRKSFIPDKKIK